MENDCIFCKIIKGEIPSNKLYETANFIVIKDAYPKVRGHTLVLSKEHYETFKDLPTNLYQEFMQTTKDSIDKVLKSEKAKAYNMVINNKKVSGQLVPHLHLHILPRKEGDGFSLKV